MKKSEIIAILCGIVCIAGLLGFFIISSRIAKSKNEAKQAQVAQVQSEQRKAQRLQQVAEQEERQNQSESSAAAPENQLPYKFVKTKTEASEQRNVMDLYAFDGDLDPYTLKTFCLDQKEKSTANPFYYLVIFDKAENAKFPDTPFTAEYGIEEESLKHIRAIYCYNRLNGFSELRYHGDNIWDNVPKRDQIK